MNFKNIAFIGLGLIGGSLARLIKETFSDTNIYAISRTAPTIEEAKKSGIITDGWNEIEKLPQNIDLVFVCTPISLIATITHQVSKHINNSNLIITDVGSIKNNIPIQVGELPNNHLFIPSHPMAGSEKTGWLNSSAKILKGKTYIVTPSEKEKKDKRYQNFKHYLQGDLMFNVLEESPAKHDELVCLASHMPYLLATATVNATMGVSKEQLSNFKQIISSGFRDTSRVSESDPNWGKEVCENNKENILNAIKSSKDYLSELEQLIENNKFEELTDIFQNIQNKRKELYK
jgi:prephenate dehydrogenase